MKSFFFSRHVVWLPKWWLILLGFLLISILMWVAVRHAATYLAVTEPINGQYLIVEGWQDETSLKQALAMFHLHHYQYLITTGGPDTRHIRPKYKTYAEQSAAFLVANGLKADKLIVIPTPASAQDRTFLSAVMVRKWLENNNMTKEKMDIFTEGVHARRTLTLYKMAFQSNDNFGIYASKPNNYSLSAWWKTSDGAKSVLTEVAGMLWVTCCFDPGKYGSHQEMWGSNQGVSQLDFIN